MHAHCVLILYPVSFFFLINSVSTYLLIWGLVVLYLWYLIFKQLNEENILKPNKMPFSS